MLPLQSYRPLTPSLTLNMVAARLHAGRQSPFHFSQPLSCGKADIQKIAFTEHNLCSLRLPTVGQHGYQSVHTPTFLHAGELLSQ